MLLEKLNHSLYQIEQFLQRYALPVIIVFSLLFSGSLWYANSRIEKNYLETHSFYHDAAFYSYYNILLHERVENEGRLKVAWFEWTHNARQPLRTTFMILFFPEELDNMTGHMVVPIFALFMFLCILGWTVYQRTRYLPYAILVMAFLCWLPWLYQPEFGLGANEVDLTAVFFTCGAALCLLNALHQNHWGWVAGFAVLASFSALSRFVAAGYVFFMCAPLYGFYLILNWRRTRSLVEGVLKPLLLTGLIMLVLTGYFLIKYTIPNLDFYAALEEGFKGFYPETPLQIAKGGIRNLYVFDYNIVLIIGIFTVNVLVWGRYRKNWFHLVAVAWIAVAQFILIVGVLDSPDVLAIIYALPGTILAGLAPMAWENSTVAMRRGLTVILAMVLMVSVNSTIPKVRDMASQPNPESKIAEQRLGDAIHEAGDKLVWNMFVEERTWMATLEAYYKYGTLAVPGGQQFFSIHQIVMETEYPGLAFEDALVEIYGRANQQLNVAVAFTDPMEVYSSGLYINAYSRYLAHFMACQLAHDPNWEPIFEIEDTGRYGHMTGYRNLQNPNLYPEYVKNMGGYIRPSNETFDFEGELFPYSLDWVDPSKYIDITAAYSVVNSTDMVFYPGEATFREQIANPYGRCWGLYSDNREYLSLYHVTAIAQTALSSEDAVQTWRDTFAPESLTAQYLLVDDEWLGTLDEEQRAIFADDTQYTLIHTWDLEELENTFYLYAPR